MPLFTTYLARRNWLMESPSRLRSVFSDTLPEFVYVMRNRGNREVEPPEMVLRLAKEGAITWEGYRDAYLDSLNTYDSRWWMQLVASRCHEKNIVLVCFERSSEHCHRRLLAELMAQDYYVEYKGELERSCDSKEQWTPWYHALKEGDHYRAKLGGHKIEDCLPENRNPNCTICHPELQRNV
jgi:hypothetical protein